MQASLDSESPRPSTGDSSAPNTADDAPPAPPSLWERAKHHKVAQWTLGYIAAAYTILHGTEMLAEALAWPPIISREITILLMLGVPICSVLAWYHGSKHLKRATARELCVIGSLVVFGAWLLWHFRTTDAPVRSVPELINRIRVSYSHIHASKKIQSSDIMSLRSDIDELLKLDPRNGTGLYYRGTVNRIEDQYLFTSDACLISQRLAATPVDIIEYQSDFLRYLDIVRALPEKEIAGDTSAELCYQRASGYCPQRIAWINHLLAYDYLGEATVSTNAAARIDNLNRALNYAKAAYKLYRDPTAQQSGFSQCSPTSAIISEAEKELAVPPRN